MKEAIYEEGDTILTHMNIAGVIYRIYYNEVNKEWVYCYRNNSGTGCIKESNIKKKVGLSITYLKKKKK